MNEKPSPAGSQAKPYINVTPLIDVLLVLLIIFMVVTPLRPGRFLAKVPSKPDHDLRLSPYPLTLVVTIKQDRTLMLNGLMDMGSVDDSGKLSAKLAQVFDERRRNHAYRDDMRYRPDLPEDLRVEKTVFIKAPLAIKYGDMARVLDAIKGTGASPVGLQIDDLN